PTLDSLRRNPPCAVSHSDAGGGRELRISAGPSALAPIPDGSRRRRGCASGLCGADIRPAASAPIRRLQYLRRRRERRLWPLRARLLVTRRASGIATAGRSN